MRGVGTQHVSLIRRTPRVHERYMHTVMDEGLCVKITFEKSAKMCSIKSKEDFMANEMQTSGLLAVLHGFLQPQ